MVHVKCPCHLFERERQRERDRERETERETEREREKERERETKRRKEQSKERNKRMKRRGIRRKTGDASYTLCIIFILLTKQMNLIIKIRNTLTAKFQNSSQTINLYQA